MTYRGDVSAWIRQNAEGRAHFLRKT